MDSTLRQAIRDNDPVREAMLERRTGTGGVQVWLDGLDPQPFDNLLLRRLFLAILPVADANPEEGTTHWARSHFARGFTLVRFPTTIVVVAGWAPGFPSRGSYDDAWADWIETPVKFTPYEVPEGVELQACRTKRTVKDQHARAMYDRVVKNVQGWVGRIARLPVDSPVKILAASFTIPQVRVYLDLDPAGD